MKALVTGASSGIGYDIAKYLSKLGYDIVAVARTTDLLYKLKQECETQVEVITLDISNKDNCNSLYESLKNENIDILVNCAGFGLFGKFVETDIIKEVDMINTNITAIHILTKLFLKDMYKRNNGYILNVASIAGFMPGPLMATYYASKAYVLRLTQAINEELRKDKSNVHVCSLCPGPVKTNFNKIAGVSFGISSLTSEYVAKYSIDKMFKRKKVIVPGISIKVIRFLSKIGPDGLVAKVAYHVQTKKQGK